MVRSYQVDPARSNPAANYTPTDADLEGHLAGIDARLVFIAPSVGTSTVEFIARGTGPTKTTMVVVGNVIGESFGVGDELFLQWVLPEDMDRAHAATLHIDWYTSTGGEAGKFVSWSCPTWASQVGAVVSATTGTVQSLNNPYSSTQYLESSTLFTFAAGTYLGPSVDSLNIKLTRIASSADPVGEPVVMHAHVHYTRA